MADDVQMVMAGLWAKWKSPKGEVVLSCTVITCEPNKLIGELHNRMPVILPEAEWPKWLGEEPPTEDELLAMLCADESLTLITHQLEKISERCHVAECQCCVHGILFVQRSRS
jgi:putative SOS response-associated peptidase YedK